jgi:cytochrome P450
MSTELSDLLLDAAKRADQDPYTLPLEKINVANPFLFARDVHGPWFKRLRDEAPVHYCPESFFGPYWSITRYADIVTVDTSHEIFSSEPAITIGDTDDDFPLPMFIAMDRPKHDEQRRVVAPVTGTENLRHFEPIIRERTIDVLVRCRDRHSRPRRHRVRPTAPRGIAGLSRVFHAAVERAHQAADEE